MSDNCILIWPYEHCTDFSKRYIFANDDEAANEGFTFDEWEEYIFSFWLVQANKSWHFTESLEDAIIEGFDMMGLPYDDEDIERVYGLIE